MHESVIVAAERRIKVHNILDNLRRNLLLRKSSDTIGYLDRESFHIAYGGCSFFPRHAFALQF